MIVGVALFLSSSQWGSLNFFFFFWCYETQKRILSWKRSFVDLFFVSHEFGRLNTDGSPSFLSNNNNNTKRNSLLSLSAPPHPHFFFCVCATKKKRWDGSRKKSLLWASLGYWIFHSQKENDSFSTVLFVEVALWKSFLIPFLWCPWSLSISF